MTNEQEIWQIDVNGQIYEANFDELTQWISEGSLLPQDKIRRGNLRWLEAGKISMLYGFFNAKELGIAPSVLTVGKTYSAEKLLPIKTKFFEAAQSSPQNIVVENAVVETSEQILQPKPPLVQKSESCAIHPAMQPEYICVSCDNVFCKACPHSYSSVKICPFCGELCEKLVAIAEKTKRVRENDSDRFGFMDFANALAYPFKFPASLIFGAVMFMFFTLGQSASAVGGLYLFSASIFCAMLANTLAFGILANAVENLAQGKTDLDFMPRFDDFSMWDDVVHPFFLSIGVYIVSFGFLLIFTIGAVWYAWSSISSAMEQPTVSNIMPDAQRDLNSAKQIPNLKQLSNQLNQNNQFKNGQVPDANQIANLQSLPVNDEEAEFQNLQEMINRSRQTQTESVVGKSPEEAQAAYRQIGIIFLQTAGLFLIPIFLSLLWGLFYFPAACAVAGYTRSFTAVINPAIGLDTIKHLGFDYVKILLMTLLLGVFTFIASLIIGIIFSPFDLPRLGNFPAVAIESLFHFYFWIVFSIILGFVLHKNSGRLNLFDVKKQWTVAGNKKKI
jgi:hypothetical protein